MERLKSIGEKVWEAKWQGKLTPKELLEINDLAHYYSTLRKPWEKNPRADWEAAEIQVLLGRLDKIGLAYG